MIRSAHSQRQAPSRPSKAIGAAVAALLAAAFVSALVAGVGCARKEPAPDEPAYRFIDHLAEARTEGQLSDDRGREVAIYTAPLDDGIGAGEGALVPFAGFTPPPEAGAAAQAAWRAARDATAHAIAPGSDERERGSRGLAIASPSAGEFTGIRTPPIRIEPGSTYRAEVWLRTDSLALPDPSVGATLLVFGLSLGPHPDEDVNARIDDAGYFANRAVLLEEISSAKSHADNTPWMPESVVVRTTRRIDHIMVAAVAHGPQPAGARSGAVRFDDLQVSQIVLPIAALAPLDDHFTGAPHALKKKARVAVDATDARKTEVTWNSFVAPVPGRYLFDMRIDEPSRLSFGFAVPPSLWNEGGAVTFAIDVAARGKEERMFEATLRPTVDDSARAWGSAEIDLSQFAGRNVTIALVTESEAGSGIGAALWGEPVIYPATPAPSGGSARAGSEVVVSGDNDGDAARTRSAAAPRGASSKANGPRGILLVSIDTLRRDRLGCYGSPRRVSPEIDRLAREGVLFETCVAPSSWTLPSHVSMHTGLSPSLHRVSGDEKRLALSRLTTAEILRHAGFATAGFVTHYYVSGDYGLDRGFESFTYHQELPAAAMCDRAGDWIAANADRPFFCFLHLFDPHWDYDPPAPYAEVVGGAATKIYDGRVDGRFDPMQPWIDPETRVAPGDLAHALDLYDGEIAAVDAAIGKLVARLEELGLADETLVIVTSDHGEEFRDHGSFGHGHSLYEEVVRVPLVVSGAGFGGVGGVNATRAATIDLAPTLVAWAGVDDAKIAGWLDDEAREREMTRGAAPGEASGDGDPASDGAANGTGAGAAASRAAAWSPEGRSLLGDTDGAGASPTAPDPRTLLSETERFGTWRMALRRGSIKFLTPGHYVWWKGFNKGPEIYDLARDPGEMHNLAGSPEGRAGIPLGDEAVGIYLARHRGLVLVFRGGDRPHIARVQIAGARLLDPTGIGLDPGDVARQSPAGVEAALTLAPHDSDILLVRAEHPETLRLNFAWDESRPPAGVVRTGPSLASVDRLPLEIAPGRSHPPLPDAETIRMWDGPGIWVLVSEEEAGTSFALDEEEIERLRALGYIQ